jgi:hypothetical protein
VGDTTLPFLFENMIESMAWPLSCVIAVNAPAITIIVVAIASTTAMATTCSTAHCENDLASRRRIRLRRN